VNNNPVSVRYMKRKTK